MNPESETNPMDSAGHQHPNDDQKEPHDTGQAGNGRSGEGSESALSRMKEVEQRRYDGAVDGAPS